ncbi:MAG: vWA domain-containing protein [Candidatus Jordarchaeales archaeon]
MWKLIERRGRKRGESKKILSAVRRGVSLAVSDFYYPPVPDPEVRVGNVKETLFYITENDWKIHINVRDVPPLRGDELVAFFRSLCRHELGHYAVCPYDVPTSTLITGSAAKQVGTDLAGFVANFFSDLVVDNYLFERYPDETVWEKKITVNYARSTGSPSKVWMVLVRCYEKMLKVKLAKNLETSREIDKAASRIVRTIRRGGVLNEETWPRKVRKVAEILKPFLEELREPTAGVKGEYKETPTGKRVFVPEDVARTMRGNPLKPPLRREGESCEKAAARHAERGERLEGFVYAARSAGLVSSEKEALRAWYRAKADMKINVKLKSARRKGAEVQVYPDIWRIDDPIEELDIPLSIQSFPRMIPGVTTKKWIKSSGESGGREGAPPDMLIVLDSSGSMEGFGDGTPFDLALIAAFSALKFAMSRSCKVAAINFSDRAIECNWTRDRINIENTLLAYQGNGTVLPVKNIIDIAMKNNSKILLLIITDTEISNWDEAVEELGKLASIGHTVCIFFIGGRAGELEERHKKLVSAGGKIYTIPSVKKLPDVVIEEVRGHYIV